MVRRLIPCVLVSTLDHNQIAHFALMMALWIVGEAMSHLKPKPPHRRRDSDR